MKVTILGTGKVGATLGLVLVARHLVTELVLLGRNAPRLEAQALDLLHATAFGRPTRVLSGTPECSKDSAVIVICTNGASTSADRLSGGAENYKVLRTLLPQLVEANPHAILLVASNPVDALTTLAGRISGLPPERVIGTGTLLDTMRLRVLLSHSLQIHPQDIRAYVLGEHGDTQFVAFSCASAGGGALPVAPHLRIEVEAAARDVGHKIVRGKGYTNFGIALAAAEIIETIARDARQVMPLSVLETDSPGHGICLSMPVVLGAGGVLRKIDIRLSRQETAALDRCRETVRSQVDAILGHAAG